MERRDAPTVSIIMPVFNTGAYLVEAINSVLNQQATSSWELPSFELLVVDDHSTDQETIEILEAAAASDSRVRVFKNERRKGAAGARNTGIINASGTWIGFLDSDDIWFPRSLALRWRLILQNVTARWAGAHFRLLKPVTSVEGIQLFESAENLMVSLDQNTDAPKMVCLPQPVAEFGNSCMIGTMTVLIQRALIIEKGMFNENLHRSSDYHLWFKCAIDNDLWMTEADVAFYRIHAGSLTHGNAPRHLHEDAMIELLLKDPAGNKHKTIFTKRFDFVMQDHCYFYREQRLFNVALKTTLRWIRKRPFNLSAWKELVACGLRIG